jgi:Glutamate 5-kinase
VKGVYTKDPKVYANEAVLVREILVDPITGSLKIDHDDDDSNGNISASGSTHDHDVTGGLETKLDAAVNVAKVGIPVIITQCGSVSAEQAVKGGMIQCTSCNDYLTSEGTIIRIKQ